MLVEVFSSLLLPLLYNISIILLPKLTCYKLDAAFRKFWWGSNSNGNSFMPKCWDSICKPKSLGGIGFKKMFDLNKALVSKLSWKLASKTSFNDSLWIKTLTSKYLGHENFLSNDSSYSNSYWIWKSITNSKDLIKKGTCFSVTSNSIIKIWKDPWIPTLIGFIPDPNHSHISPNYNLVRALILENHNS